MNRYWFLKFSKYLSICYDFSKFRCLVVKTGFNFTTCLAPRRTIFLSWIGTPDLRCANPFYAGYLLYTAHCAPQDNFSVSDWHPACTFLQRTNPIYEGCYTQTIAIRGVPFQEEYHPAGCLTGRKIQNRFLHLGYNTLKNKNKKRML